MKTLLTPMFCLFLLTSCKYNTEQKALLSKIENSKSEISEENFKNVISDNFAKDDLAELSSNQDAKIAIYFYEILLKKYPTEAFHIFLKNINNTEKIVISTSYVSIK